MSKHRIKIIDADRRESYVDVEATLEPPHSLVVVMSDSEVYRFEAKDLFDALAEMRKKFASMGLKVLCQGARRNAWASGMSRDMVGGRLAYILEMGVVTPSPKSDPGDLRESRRA